MALIALYRAFSTWPFSIIDSQIMIDLGHLLRDEAIVKALALVNLLVPEAHRLKPKKRLAGSIHRLDVVLVTTSWYGNQTSLRFEGPVLIWRGEKNRGRY